MTRWTSLRVILLCALSLSPVLVVKSHAKSRAPVGKSAVR
jgi:hypothetical protein